MGKLIVFTLKIPDWKSPQEGIVEKSISVWKDILNFHLYHLLSNSKFTDYSRMLFIFLRWVTITVSNLFYMCLSNPSIYGLICCLNFWFNTAEKVISAISCAGDEVVEWNGRSLQGKSYQEVYDIIAESKQEPQVELIVTRLLQSYRGRYPATSPTTTTSSLKG